MFVRDMIMFKNGLEIKYMQQLAVWLSLKEIFISLPIGLKEINQVLPSYMDLGSSYANTCPI